MPQQSRTMYQLDTRSEEERDADIKEWVKAHSTDYREQKQAASGMPPEDPSGGHGAGDYRGGGNPTTPSMWVWIISGAIGSFIGIVAAYLVFS